MFLLQIFIKVTRDLDSNSRVLKQLEESLASGGSSYITPEKITILRDKWEIFTSEYTIFLFYILITHTRTSSDLLLFYYKWRSYYAVDFQLILT